MLYIWFGVIDISKVIHIKEYKTNLRLIAWHPTKVLDCCIAIV